VGMDKWDAYSKARDTMMKATHSNHAPWTVVRYNDKRRGRIEVLRHVLLSMNYPDKNIKVIGKPNNKIIGTGPEFLDD
jgi:polyphosphate kinase